MYVFKKLYDDQQNFQLKKMQTILGNSNWIISNFHAFQKKEKEIYNISTCNGSINVLNCSDQKPQLFNIY